MIVETKFLTIIRISKKKNHHFRLAFKNWIFVSNLKYEQEPEFKLLSSLDLLFSSSFYDFRGKSNTMLLYLPSYISSLFQKAKFVLLFPRFWRPCFSILYCFKGTTIMLNRPCECNSVFSLSHCLGKVQTIIKLANLRKKKKKKFLSRHKYLKSYLNL